MLVSLIKFIFCKMLGSSVTFYRKPGSGTNIRIYYVNTLALVTRTCHCTY